MDDAPCDRCRLGLDPCYARASGIARLCELARRELDAESRGERPATDYRALIRERSGSPPAPGPSLVGRVASLVRSAARHVAAGMPLASAEVLAARLDTCRRCPQFRHVTGRCGACGCKLQLKASWQLEECPEGRWPKPV